jgi:tRNA A22 N-methylase
MVRILSQGLELMRNRAVRLILNPLGNSKEPREFIADHGFDLLADTVVNGRGREYEVLVAQR